MALIDEKMSAIMAEISPIAKTEKNQQQGYYFRSIDNVMNELHSIFARHRVNIYPAVKDPVVVENRPTKSESSNVHIILPIEYTFVAEDGSSRTIVVTGEGMDAGDKATNKAMSAALKYGLLQVFLIPTDEKKDGDFDTPEESDYFTVIKSDIRNAVSKEGLNRIWNENWPTIQLTAYRQEFVNLVNKKKDEFEDITGAI